MKKFLSFVFSLGLAVSMMQTAVMANSQEELIRVWGRIQNITENMIHITNETDNYNNVMLKVDETTVIIDAAEGTPMSIKDLKTAETVYAYVSPVMTRSMPPMSVARVIIANMPQDVGAPKYFKVKEVLESGDGSIRVLDSTNSLIATINKDTDLAAFKTRNIVSVDDIKEGTELVAWYDVVALSLPGQTTFRKAVILPELKNGWVNEENEWSYYVNGNLKTNSWIPSSQGRWYYVGQDGKMVRNTVIDGCAIDAEGVYRK